MQFMAVKSLTLGAQTVKLGLISHVTFFLLTQNFNLGMCIMHIAFTFICCSSWCFYDVVYNSYCITFTGTSTTWVPRSICTTELKLALTVRREGWQYWHPQPSKSARRQLAIGAL